jgi:hypothetical protein
MYNSELTVDVSDFSEVVEKFNRAVKEFSRAVDKMDSVIAAYIQHDGGTSDRPKPEPSSTEPENQSQVYGGRHQTRDGESGTIFIGTLPVPQNRQ